MTTPRPVATFLAAALTLTAIPAITGSAPPAGAANITWTAHDVAEEPATDFNSVAVGDLDGDGDLDLASTAPTANRVSWHENDGTPGGGWLTNAVSTTALGASSVVVADLDGDGDLDLVTAQSEDEAVMWYENSGGAVPVFTPNVIVNALNEDLSADGARSVVVADLDGDDDLDVASASANDDTIAWYENDGAADPTFTPSDVATSADGASSVAADDLDGDGDLDLASASANDGTVAWYENTAGDGSAWTAREVATSADGAQSVAIGDLDGDGDLDLASASEADDTIAWYENADGDASAWTARDIVTDADGAEAVTLADLDGDLDLDLVSASTSDDTVAWYENDGAVTPGFTSRTIATTADGAAGVAIDDIDVDGHRDVVAASRGDTKITWHENGLPEPVLSIADAKRREGKGKRAKFTISADHALTIPITANVSTQDGSAQAGKDYVPKSGAGATIAPDTLSTKKRVKIKNDRIDEKKERFKLVLSEPTNATLGDDTGKAVIRDDDPKPRVRIKRVEKQEGTPGQGAQARPKTKFKFLVKLNRPSSKRVVVRYRTKAITATPNLDFKFFKGRLVFGNEQRKAKIKIKVFQDFEVENTEKFLVKLTKAKKAKIKKAKAKGIIIDDD